MARKVKGRIGLKGQLKDVVFDVPDGVPDPWTPEEKLQVVGTPVRRVEAEAKVTGKARYTTDHKLPGMLHGAVLRAPVPRAVVKKVNVSKAKQVAGVKAVVVLDGRDVRFLGQEIAAVAATRPEIAAEAVARIQLDYERGPFVVDLDAAMEKDAPAVYPPSSRTKLEGNIREVGRSMEGDPASAMGRAKARIRSTYRTRVQTHSCLEPHGAVARWEGDRLTVWTSTQATFTVRDELAEALEIPRERVQVICKHMGAGFGSKLTGGREAILAARLAREAGAPVRLIFDREADHLATGNRPSALMKLELGAKADGSLLAMTHESHGSGGVAGGAACSQPFTRMYRCPNRLAVDHDVYTNTGGARPFRAPGHPQGCFSLEQAIDEVASKLDMDPLELRLRNDLHPVRKAEMKLGAKRAGWDARHAPGADPGPVKRGLGMASGLWYNTGGPPAEIRIRLNEDGGVELFCGGQDIGTGTRTVLATVAGEVLGIAPERILIRIGDTEYPYAPSSGGSKTTPCVAPVVHAAAADLRDRIFEVARPLLKAGEGDPLEARDGHIRLRRDPGRRVSFERAARALPGGPLSVQASRYKDFEQWNSQIGGVQFAHVAVDVETGVIKVERVVAVHDCGRVLSELTARSQVIGGVIQGVSYALYEERIMDQGTGRMVNANLEQYKIAGARDIPVIEPIFMNVYNGGNTIGVTGLGEPVTVPTSAAVANAVYNAIGVRVRELPMTPARVLAALSGSGPSQE